MSEARLVEQRLVVDGEDRHVTVFVEVLGEPTSYRGRDPAGRYRFHLGDRWLRDDEAALDEGVVLPGLLTAAGDRGLVFVDDEAIECVAAG